MSVSKTKKLLESSIMVAIASVLSMIKLFDLPYGGSVTIGCMLPIIVIAYRHGVRWGLISGLVFGIIQQLLGLNTLSYVTTWQSIVAVIFLDYIIAFLMLGFGGIFKKSLSQPGALLSGTVFVCILRYICHVISGATVWAGLSIPTNAALLYSLGYNATYMIPETIVTCVLAYYIGSILDFRGSDITHLAKSKNENVSVFNAVGGLLLAAALVFDVRTVFANLQNPESGDFDITGLSAVNWGVLGIVSAVCVLISVVMFVTASKKKAKSTQSDVE